MSVASGGVGGQRMAIGPHRRHTCAHADEYYRVPPRLDDLTCRCLASHCSNCLPRCGRLRPTASSASSTLRGRSFVEQLRNLGGNFNDGRCVDIVAFPRDETEVRLFLGACNDGVRGRPLCCVPWGGGSSVSDGWGSSRGHIRFCAALRRVCAATCADGPRPRRRHTVHDCAGPGGCVRACARGRVAPAWLDAAALSAVL